MLCNAVCCTVLCAVQCCVLFRWQKRWRRGAPPCGWWRCPATWGAPRGGFLSNRGCWWRPAGGTPPPSPSRRTFWGGTIIVSYLRQWVALHRLIFEILELKQGKTERFVYMAMGSPPVAYLRNIGTEARQELFEFKIKAMLAIGYLLKKYSSLFL